MNRIARETLKAAGGGTLAERYLAVGNVDVGRIVEELRRARPDFVLNTLIGASSYAFLEAIAALLTAHRAFAERQRFDAEIGALCARLDGWEAVVQAALLLAARGGSEVKAYDRLRQIAMARQVTIENAARKIAGGEGGDGRRRGA